MGSRISRISGTVRPEFSDKPGDDWTFDVQVINGRLWLTPHTRVQLYGKGAFGEQGPGFHSIEFSLEDLWAAMGDAL